MRDGWTERTIESWRVQRIARAVEVTGLTARDLAMLRVEARIHGWRVSVWDVTREDDAAYLYIEAERDGDWEAAPMAGCVAVAVVIDP